MCVYITSILHDPKIPGHFIVKGELVARLKNRAWLINEELVLAERELMGPALFAPNINYKVLTLKFELSETKK